MYGLEGTTKTRRSPSASTNWMWLSAWMPSRCRTSAGMTTDPSGRIGTRYARSGTYVPPGNLPESIPTLAHPQSSERSSRSPFSTTMTVLPSWPTTPSGSGMPTVSAETTSVAMTASEKARFCRIVRRVLRLSAIA